jgi:type IV pilus assembly protein PilM
MISLGKHKTKTVVGLDVEASSAAAVELSTNGRTNVGGYGVVRLDTGIFRDGEVREPEELAGALKELFGANKLSKDVRLGIANQRVAVRTLRLPRIEDPGELETAIRFQAQDQIPVPLEQAVLDWQVIPPADPAQEGIDVVAVAARRDMLAGAMESVERAGLRLVGIDLSAFALVRALQTEASAPTEVIGAPLEEGTAADPAMEAAPTEETAVLPYPSTRLFCHLGDLTNLAVARGGYCVFTRVVSFGVEGIAQSLAERTALTLDHARQWIAHVGLDAAPETIEGDPRTVSATREALASGAARLGDELRRSLEYFGGSDGAVPVDEVIVAGPGTAIPGLVERLQEQLPVPLHPGIPGSLVAAAGPDAPRLTVSYGLGLEE